MHSSTLTASFVAIAASLATAIPMNNADATASVHKRQSMGFQTFGDNDFLCSTSPLSNGQVFNTNVGDCVPTFSDSEGNFLAIGSILPVGQSSTATFQLYTDPGMGCTGNFYTVVGNTCASSSEFIFAVAQVG